MDPFTIAEFGGSLFGGIFGSSSAKKAAKEQAAATRYAADVQKEISQKNIDFQTWLYNQQTAQQKPWYDAGVSALNTIQTGLSDGSFDPGKLNLSGLTDPGEFSFDPSSVDVTKDPSYKFRLDEGLKGMERMAAAKGQTLSGAQQKALSQYMQDYASTEYGNAYNRNYANALQNYQSKVDQYGRKVNAATMDYNSNVNRLGNMFNQYNTVSGQGLQTLGLMGNAANQYGGNVANAYTNQGNTLASLYSNIGKAEAQGTLGSSTAIGQTLSNLYNIGFNNKLLDAYYGNKTPTSASAANAGVDYTPSGYTLADFMTYNPDKYLTK